MKNPILYLKNRYWKFRFVFKELIKRDFKKKYKRSVLGIFWSVLAPLFTLLIMNFVFGNFLGRGVEHYVIYLFAGILVIRYYSTATRSAMVTLMSNSGIFSKIDIPKYLFLFANVISSSIDFLATLLVFFVFVYLHNIPFTVNFLLLIIPFACLFLIIIGVSMIVSIMNVYFRDIDYLYGIFLMALYYFTPIFYMPEMLGENEYILYFNPLFLIVQYIRDIVIQSSIPNLQFQLTMIIYSLIIFAVGCICYKNFNYKIIYHI